MMGMLKEPEEREKYTEDELVSIVMSYEQIRDEMMKIDQKIRSLDPKDINGKKKLSEQKDSLAKSK